MQGLTPAAMVSVHGIADGVAKLGLDGCPVVETAVDRDRA